jgi:hypothetical protein
MAAIQAWQAALYTLEAGGYIDVPSARAAKIKANILIFFTALSFFPDVLKCTVLVLLSRYPTSLQNSKSTLF